MRLGLYSHLTAHLMRSSPTHPFPQLHHLAVKWHPLNPELAALPSSAPFSWEYVCYDDLLMELKLQPEVLEVPPPMCLRADRGEELAK